MFAAIQGLEETIFNYTRDNQVTNRQKWKENDGENHFHVRPRNKTKQAHEHQLGQLASSELVDFTLGNSTDVVIGRISGLLREEESNALKHLIATESSNGHVKEKAIKDGRWDVGQRIRQQQDRQANEDMGEKDRQSSLPHSNNSVKNGKWKQIKLELKLQANFFNVITFDRRDPDGLVPRHPPMRGRVVANAEQGRASRAIRQLRGRPLKWP